MPFGLFPFPLGNITLHGCVIAPATTNKLATHVRNKETVKIQINYGKNKMPCQISFPLSSL
jgi:hypothetical protein